MKLIPPLEQQTTIYPKQFDGVIYRRRISKGLALGLTMLAASILLIGGLLYAQESDDALFIDESGNVTVGKNLNVNENLGVSGIVKAEKFKGNGSTITVGGVEFVKQVKGTPPLTLEEVVRAVIADMVPIGTIMAYGGDVTNQSIKDNLEAQGWLPCDGAKKEVSEYKNLYDIIGNAFGGDGNNFYLPDMRGRFLRGVNHDATEIVDGKKVTRDPDVEERKHPTSGKKVGGKVGSVQEDKVGSHRHMVYSDGCKEGEKEYGFKKSGMGGSKPGTWHSRRTAKIGEDIGPETRPKNIYVNWIIKAKHIIRTRQ